VSPLVAGLVAAVPGAGAVLLAGVHTPPDARLWIWVAAAGVLVAVHPALRWACTVAMVGILVGVVLGAGVSGLPVTAAAGLGVLLLAYLLALDLADLLSGANGGSVPALAVGWTAAMAMPVAAGLGACALALLVVAAPVSPSLPLALAGPLAVVALSALAMRRPGRPAP
jgi:hypothetical protein